MLTNTHSVGVVRDAVIAWRVRAGGADASGYWWSLPVVAETWDGASERHQRLSRAARARRSRARRARSGGPVAEGNVGGGTGMICHEFKCGIGTASRRVDASTAATTRSACWCRPTTACATRCASPACRWARSCATTASTARPTPRRRHRLDHHRGRDRCAAAAASARSASRSARGTGPRAAWAASPATARATSSSPSRRPTPRRSWAAQLSHAPSSIGNDHLDPLFEATVAGDRRGDRQRDGRGARHAGQRGPLRHGAAARRAGRPAQALRPYAPATRRRGSGAGPYQSRSRCMRSRR